MPLSVSTPSTSSADEAHAARQRRRQARAALAARAAQMSSVRRHQLVQLVERPLGRRIARRVAGIGMGLEEEAVGAGGGRGAQQRRDELAQAAARAARALPGCCTLWVASKITGAPRRRAQPREAAHVDHEVAVAEEGAALGDAPRRALPAAAHLLHRAAIASGCIHCPFFTFTGLPGAPGGDEQVGLAAEEGRDLQHVDDLGRGGRLGGLVHVGEDRQARRRSHPLERLESLVEPGPRARRRAGRVGLVEARLEARPGCRGRVGERGEVLGDAQACSVVRLRPRRARRSGTAHRPKRPGHHVAAACAERLRRGRRRRRAARRQRRADEPGEQRMRARRAAT